MICPNCQSQEKVTEQNFGALYTCTACQAVYFINFDGEPEFGEVPEEIPADFNSTDAEIDSELSDTAENHENFDAQLEASFDNRLQQNFDSPPAQEAFAQNQFEPVNQEVSDSTFPTPDAALPDTEKASFESVSEVASSPESNFDYLNSDVNPFENPIESENIEPKEKSPFSNVAQEISDFGNTETQIAGLSYDLAVSGLDTLEIKKLFKEVIEDSKFGWDVEALMGSIKNGEIRLERLSAVKAYILARRLQFLNIEKTWKQNALT